MENEQVATHWSRRAVAVTQILLLGCGIFEIVICSSQLMKFNGCAYTPQGGSVPCNYLIALGAVSIVHNVVAFTMQLVFGRGNKPVTATIDVMMAFALFFWWIAGGSYFTHWYWVAAGNGSPSGANGNWIVDSYRTAVYAVAWAAVGLSALSLVLSVLSLDNANAEEKKAREKHHHDEEQQISAVYAAPPPNLPAGDYPPPPAGYAPPSSTS